MRRAWTIWLAFGLCLLVVLGAMAWVSLTALRLERVEADAVHRADFEERVRLALWRMDSALAPLITRESARPYFAYTAFYPVDRAYTRMFAQIQPHEVLVPSPLLTYRSPAIRIQFQFEPSGKLTSPQVPVGNQRDLAETGYTTHEEITAAAGRLAKLAQALDRDVLLAALPPVGADAVAAAILPARTPRRQGARDRLAQQQAISNAEWEMREYSANRARAAQAAAKTPVGEGAMQAVCAGRTLVLARRVRVGGDEYVQGCWLGWEHIRASLLKEVEDLLPQAKLLLAAGAAAPDPGGSGQSCMLASLPVRLIPGDAPGDGATAYASPLRMALAIAWACVLVGALAVGILLRGTMVLSERRGAFVSAVTHELRTPLTTFRLYADMLAQGLITDEAKRSEYLRRLQDESGRLSHLVANVLAYARLSGAGASTRVETVTLGALIARSRERLAARAEQAEMELIVEEGAAAATSVRADPAAVEQILMNLVDNACKYAGRSVLRRIHLEPARRGRRAMLVVRDHGPGLAASDAKWLFQPFRKSARDAARSGPGVGLGLALSRRLAREMGGDLRLDDAGREGACFVLSLPVDEP